VAQAGEAADGRSRARGRPEAHRSSRPERHGAQGRPERSETGSGDDFRIDPRVTARRGWRSARRSAHPPVGGSGGGSARMNGVSRLRRLDSPEDQAPASSVTRQARQTGEAGTTSRANAEARPAIPVAEPAWLLAG